MGDRTPAAAQYRQQCVRLADERDDARAEVERLRDALTRMATPGEFERGPEFRRFAREVLQAQLHDPWVMDQ